MSYTTPHPSIIREELKTAIIEHCSIPETSADGQRILKQAQSMHDVIGCLLKSWGGVSHIIPAFAQMLRAEANLTGRCGADHDALLWGIEYLAQL